MITTLSSTEAPDILTAQEQTALRYHLAGNLCPPQDHPAVIVIAQQAISAARQGDWDAVLATDADGDVTVNDVIEDLRLGFFVN